MLGSLDLLSVLLIIEFKSLISLWFFKYVFLRCYHLMIWQNSQLNNLIFISFGWAVVSAFIPPFQKTFIRFIPTSGVSFSLFQSLSHSVSPSISLPLYFSHSLYLLIYVSVGILIIYPSKKKDILLYKYFQSYFSSIMISGCL